MKIINAKIAQGYAFSLCGIVPGNMNSWRKNTLRMLTGKRQRLAIDDWYQAEYR